LVTAGVVAVGSVAVGGAGPGLVLAALAVPAAVLAVTRLDSRSGAGLVDASLPLALDLVVAALRAGQPVASALLLAAPAASAPAAAGLSRVGGLLRLGADPAEAWQVLADQAVLGAVAAAACRSSTSGVRLARAFEQLATQLRDQRRATAQARAQRAGVFAMAPLGACFLPAFVCLGIVPTAVGIIGNVLGTLP
jgi:Flp pilus assembly protein TadB